MRRKSRYFESAMAADNSVMLDRSGNTILHRLAISENPPLEHSILWEALVRDPTLAGLIS